MSKQKSDSKRKAFMATSKELDRPEAVSGLATQATTQRQETILFQLLQKKWVPFFLISLLGLGLYINTFNHQYALDDEMVVCRNNNVLKGVSGIKDILTSDIFESYYKQTNSEAKISGGRYRPFSLVTYALEQELIGTFPDGIQKDSWDLNGNQIGDPDEDLNEDGIYDDLDVMIRGMSFRHVNNVLLYILSGFVLLMFLRRNFFKENEVLALLIVLLFMAHPIHTEVVANVKSRDEILSLMFIILTLHSCILYFEVRKVKYLFWTLICFFIALLSKEYAVILLIILPVLYLVLGKKVEVKDLVKLGMGMLITFSVYFVMRNLSIRSLGTNEILKPDLMSNPFMFATSAQAWATKIFIHLKYFSLLVFPIQLSSDYNYNAIPYRSFDDFRVWVSLCLLFILTCISVLAIFKRKKMALPLMLILLPLMLVNNFFFEIGATMGERLVYHSSLGVMILLVVGIHYSFAKLIKQSYLTTFIVFVPLMLYYSVKTIARNPAWKNNLSLITSDVKINSNSFSLNDMAAMQLLNLSSSPHQKFQRSRLLDSAYRYAQKAIQLNPNYLRTLIIAGMIKSEKGEMDSALLYWQQAKKMEPNDSTVHKVLSETEHYYLVRGVEFYKQNKLDSAIHQLGIAQKIAPNHKDAYYYLGLTYLALNNKQKAKELFQKGLSIDPSSKGLQSALHSIE